MIAWPVLLFFLPLLVAAAILIPLLARGRRSRAPVGTGRRIVGAALIVLGAAGLLGGQLLATRPPPEEEEPRVPVIVEDGIDGSGRLLVRVLTLDMLLPDRPRLVEQAVFRLEGAGEVHAPAETYDGTESPKVRVRLEEQTGNGHGQIYVELVLGAGTCGSGAAAGPGPREVLIRNRPRGRWAPFGATFKDAVFPSASDARTLVLVDPAPARMELRPFHEAMGGPLGDRVRLAIRERHPGGHGWSHARGGQGFPGLGSALSFFALGFLLVGGFGALLVGKRTGAWLGVYLVLAPLLLVAADRLAFERHCAALESDDPHLRASAMLGLRESPFFARSGREIVEEIAARESDGLARTVLDAQVVTHPPTVRKNLLSGSDLMAELLPEEQP